MTWPILLECVLAGLGCALVVLPTLAMLLLPSAADRLHLLAPTSSLGVPLVAIALIVANGISLTSGEVLLIAVLVALMGPAVTAAIARVQHGTDHERTEEPE